MGLGILFWLKDNLSPSPWVKKSLPKRSFFCPQDTQDHFRCNSENAVLGGVMLLWGYRVAEKTRNFA